MPLCNRSHPDRVGITCDQQEGNHQRCSGFVAELGDYEDWLNPAYVVPKNNRKGRKGAQERLNVVATRVNLADRVGPPDMRRERLGPIRRTWDERERQLVMDAIIAVAKRRDEFTYDDVWVELNGAVPRGDGDLYKLIRVAARRGILDSTGKVESVDEADPQRDRMIWYSLIQEKR